MHISTRSSKSLQNYHMRVIKEASRSLQTLSVTDKRENKTTIRTLIMHRLTII